MSDEKKGGKVGFLSSSYRPANGLTASESRVLSETIATEGGWYCKEVPGHRPSDAAFDAKNTYLSHISKKAVNTPTDLPADLDLFTRVTASRATGDYKYCSKCKRDCYFCRHREEFASPDPKETYIVPAATNMLYGWVPNKLQLEKPAPISTNQTSTSSTLVMSPSGRPTIVVGSKSAKK